MKFPSPTNTVRGRLIWWAKPHMMCIWHLIPIVSLCGYFGKRLAADRGVPSNLDLPNFLGLLGAISTLAVGSAVAFRVKAPEAGGKSIPNRWLNIFFFLSTFAFVIWFYELITNPALFLSMLLRTEGSVYQIRQDYATIPGVTTLTQAGIAYMCVVAFKYPCLKGLPSLVRIQIALLFLMAFFRMFAWSERLALIELSAPILLAFAVRFDGFRFSLLFKLAPLAGFIGLFVLFAATEYFRSWTNAYQGKYDSLGEFVLLRVSEYYYFAISSGLGILAAETSIFPYNSMQWLLKFPLVGDLISNGFNISTMRGAYLESLGLLELNNFGGILALFADYGVIGGGLTTFLLGFMVGRASKGFLSRSTLLGLMYPIFFIAILDLPRIFYLGESRASIPLALLAILWGFQRKRVVPECFNSNPKGLSNDN